MDYYNSKEFQPLTNESYRDDQKTQLRHMVKHSDYNIRQSFPYKILSTLIQNIIGEHKLNHGNFTRCYMPFGLHIDTNESLSDKAHNLSTDSQNTALLIPFTEHESCKTIFFDFFQQEEFGPDTVVPRDQQYQHDLELFGHCRSYQFEKLKHLKIETVFDWRLGDAVTWPRDQLHSAGNFLDKLEYKEFLILHF